MNIPLIRPDLPTMEDVRAPFAEILASGKITNFGKYVKQFESETAAYVGAETVAVSSGTVGLLFTLSSVGFAPGAKVILPSFTFMATAQAVLYAGGWPVFAEVDEDLNLSPRDLEHLLDQHPETAAVVGVHMYGLPARTAEIEGIVGAASRRRGRPIALFFDAAHAFGSSVEGRRTGSSGDAEVFSLSVTKALVSVEGGLVSTKNPDLAERIRFMRNYGFRANYDAHFPGLNGKMSEFHAVVGLHNLRRFDQLLATRQERARHYADQVHRHTSFRMAAWPPGVVHTLKDFTVLVPSPKAECRNEVIRFLAERGVETRAYFFPPVHEQKYFCKYADRPLPKTEALSRRVITLPFYSSISNQEIDYVVEQLVEAERRLAL
ncbi:MAG: DegT/DnrJ/EryC1/StrS family aminotransferase [Terriglobia bacterium]